MLNLFCHEYVLHTFHSIYNEHNPYYISAEVSERTKWISYFLAVRNTFEMFSDYCIQLSCVTISPFNPDKIKLILVSYHM